jgi:hypothetical protein
MPRGRKPGSTNKPKALTGAMKLLAALDFVSVAVGTDEVWKQHVILANNEVRAFNSILGASHKIEEDLNVCPHFEFLRRALQSCGKSVSITENSAGNLTVTGEKLRVIVPCLSIDAMNMPIPDEKIAPINDEIKVGMNLLAPLITDNAPTMVQASMLLQQNTCVATDRGILIEFWHGNDLPPGLVLPKVAINAISKVKAKLVGFGFNVGRSATFYFDDDSWIKTQLFNDPWPEYAHIVNVNVNKTDIPAEFFTAVEAVAPFSDDGDIYFVDGAIMSHGSEDERGARYEISVPNPRAFRAKHLLAIREFAKEGDFVSYPQKALFFGTIGENIGWKNVRGAIIGKALQQAEEQRQATDPLAGIPDFMRRQYGQPLQSEQASQEYVNRPNIQHHGDISHMRGEPVIPQGSFDLAAHNAAVAADGRTINEKMYPGISATPAMDALKQSLPQTGWTSSVASDDEFPIDNPT